MILLLLLLHGPRLSVFRPVLILGLRRRRRRRRRLWWLWLLLLRWLRSWLRVRLDELKQRP
jgi:hypothetical protein